VETVQFDPAALQAWHVSLPEPPPPPPCPPLLQVENLVYSYEEAEAGGKPALGGVSFTIGKGERVAIAGKNGAGKSTLAGLVCGFMAADEGAIRFAEKGGMCDMASLSIKERAERVGFVMQNPNHMISFPQIFDEAAYGLRNRGRSEEETRSVVEEMLHICGLYPFRKWPVAALSYGQKKRLTIASILALGTETLILDEPTAGQDWRHYTEIMEFLARLGRERGLTLIMITHDMHLMLEYTDRALVLADGELAADGNPADILSDDKLCDMASLKRTSLYDLARRAGIADAGGFIRRFISAEEEEMEQEAAF
jgi:energy-coupling factor transport system ATP-binding protein